MTIEEFKEEFLNHRLCIHTPTQQDAEDVVSAIVRSGIARRPQGSHLVSYDASVYPYVIFHYDVVTAYTGADSDIKRQIHTTLTTDECLSILNGEYEIDDPKAIDLSSLI